MAVAAQVVAKVNADISGLKQGYQQAKDETEKQKGWFKGAMSDMFSVAGGMLLSSGIQYGMQLITSTISSVVDEAGLLTNAESQMNAVLKSTGDASGMTAQSLMDLADSMSKASGASESTILTGQNMLLTFTNISSSVFPQASQALLDMGVAFNHGTTNGLDLKDMAIQLGKALNDPLQGMNALRREGVTFSKDEEDLIKHFMAVGDVADAQKVMLQELQKEFGGSAAAAGNTFGGALNKLKNIVIDFGANALQKIEVWAQPVVDAFAKWLPGALDTAGQWFGKLSNFWTTTLQPELKEIARIITVDAAPGFNAIAGAVQRLLGPFQNLHGITVQWQPLFNQVNNVVWMATQGFNTLATILSGQVAQSFDSTLKDWGPIIQNLAGWFQTSMLPALQSIMPPAERLINTIVTKGIPAFFTIRDAVSHVAAVIASTLLPIFETVEPIIARIAGWLLDMGQKALAFLIPKVEDAVQSISKFADQMSTRLGPFIQRISGDIQTVAGIVQNVWGTLWPWVSSLLKFAWDDITGILNIAWQVIQGIFKVGADLLSGNWSQAWKDIQDTFQNVWGAIKGFFGTLWGDIQGIAQAGINAFIDLLNHLIDVANKIPGVHISHISHVDFSGGDMTYTAPDANGAGSGGSQGAQHFATGGVVGPGDMLTRINDANGAGELVKLPTGTVVFPHDQSVQMLQTMIQQQQQPRQQVYAPNYTINGVVDSNMIVQKMKLHQQVQKALYFR